MTFQSLRGCAVELHYTHNHGGWQVVDRKDVKIFSDATGSLESSTLIRRMTQLVVRVAVTLFNSHPSQFTRCRRSESCP